MCRRPRSALRWISLFMVIAVGCVEGPDRNAGRLITVLYEGDERIFGPYWSMPAWVMMFLPEGRARQRRFCCEEYYDSQESSRPDHDSRPVVTREKAHGPHQPSSSIHSSSMCHVGSARYGELNPRRRRCATVLRTSGYRYVMGRSAWSIGMSSA